MQQAKHPRIESRNPNTYFLAIGRFAPQSGQRRAQPQPLSPSCACWPLLLWSTCFG